MRLQATGSFNPDDGYSFSFVVGDSPLISFEGFTEEEVIYLRDLFDVLLPDDKCQIPPDAADEVSQPRLRTPLRDFLRTPLSLLVQYTTNGWNSVKRAIGTLR